MITCPGNGGLPRAAHPPISDHYGRQLPSAAARILAAALLGALLLLFSGCGELNADELISPELVTARISVDPSEPFEKAGVELVLRLEAGSMAAEQAARLEYVRLFEGSSWRTNEPAVELPMEMPEEALAPFEAGEVREIVLDGYTPNDLFTQYCGEALSLLVAIRTTGFHALLGTSEDVLVECE